MAGRPLGTTGPRPERTAVVTWKPIHDQVVMLYLAGYGNIEIGTALGLTPEHVGQLILDPRARALIQKGRNSIVNGVMQEIDTKLVGLARKSLDNLERTVNAVIPVRHPAKRHQDKVGVDLLKMIGYGSESGSARGQDSGSQMSPEAIDRLSRALERSEKVRQIIVQQPEDGKEIEEAVVIESKVANG